MVLKKAKQKKKENSVLVAFHYRKIVWSSKCFKAWNNRGINFFLEMLPILQCKEFLCIQGNVFVVYWILLYNNYGYFFIFWPVTNEPWAKICYQKLAMTAIKSVRPFNMTGHCQKNYFEPWRQYHWLFNNNEWGWVSADNTLRDLYNSSYDTKAKFNDNCFIIHSK